MTSIRDFMNPRWLVILVAALLALHCAPSEEAAVEGWNCSGEDLMGGLYSFAVDEVDDSCGIEPLDASIVGRYKPVVLPGFVDLPSQTEMELPLVGSEIVLLSVQGETIHISLGEQEEAVVDLGGCQLGFRFNGVLCPATEHEIDVRMRFTFVETTELAPGACEGFSFEAGCTVTARSQCRKCL